MARVDVAEILRTRKNTGNPEESRERVGENPAVRGNRSSAMIGCNYI